ncbi:MAG: class I SAM-dependent RNA methyltransferase [Ruminococcaceae bacterium]|nr:class I SAM-dependent RNA methyltransferase [Oscillospiraceae bacterium]
MRFVTSCLFGLEKFVGEDVDKLGYKRIDTMDGRVTFEGDISAVARCNVNFRYSERVYIKLGEFEAFSFTELFDNVEKLKFSDFINQDDVIIVTGSSVRSKLFSVRDCQSIIKKAVIKSLEKSYGVTFFPETGVKKRIEFFIFNDRVSIMLDTSGAPLHKRGYRPTAGVAPLRETLASSMVNLSRLREGVATVDPFCGSGTIPIEAALMSINRAPGLNRKFDSMDFDFIPKKIWNNALEEAKDNETEGKVEIFGYDIDSNVLELAKENAKRAGVEHLIRFEVKNAEKFVSPYENCRGTIVTNPPYGERMLEKKEAEQLFRNFGKAVRENVPNWKMYIINSHEEFERCFGKRADKVRKLYNGMIKCYLYQYFKTPK